MLENDLLPVENFSRRVELAGDRFVATFPRDRFILTVRWFRFSEIHQPGPVERAICMNGKEPHSEDQQFLSISQQDVPKGRDGKHKKIVGRLLTEIERLKPGTALKVPLGALPDSKENIRSALNRATRQRGVDVATSSDTDHLYIWRTEAHS
jgi:hypothetical protein